jgi:hypothetical protein
VWVTRLRATLPVDALAVGDLRLEPSPTQSLVSNQHQATKYTDENKQSGCTNGPRRREAFSAYALLAVAALAASAIARRRARRR